MVFINFLSFVALCTTLWSHEFKMLLTPNNFHICGHIIQFIFINSLSVAPFSFPIELCSMCDDKRTIIHAFIWKDILIERNTNKRKGRKTFQKDTKDKKKSNNSKCIDKTFKCSPSPKDFLIHSSYTLSTIYSRISILNRVIWGGGKYENCVTHVITQHDLSIVYCEYGINLNLMNI